MADFYIEYTSQKGYENIKSKMTSATEEDTNKYNHTLFVISEVGLPASNTNTTNFYLGNALISDIINLNTFDNIIITEDTITGFLTVTLKSNREKDTLICDSSKLYIYCKYDYNVAEAHFNIYYYNTANQVYMPITKNGIFSHDINFVPSAEDINNQSMWQDRTVVYYPQSGEYEPTTNVITINIPFSSTTGTLQMSISGVDINSNPITFLPADVSTYSNLTSAPNVQTNSISWSATSGSNSITLDLQPGTYTLVNSQSPNHYNTLSNQTITIPSTIETYTFELEQYSADTTISVKDATTSSLLEDVTLSLTGVDESSNPITFSIDNIVDDGDAIFTSTSGNTLTFTVSSQNVVLDLYKGTYTLTIISVPEDYVIPANIVFTAIETTQINCLITEQLFKILTSSEVNSLGIGMRVSSGVQLNDNLYSSTNGSTTTNFLDTIANIPNFLNQLFTQIGFTDVELKPIYQTNLIPDQSSYVNINSNAFIWESGWGREPIQTGRTTASVAINHSIVTYWSIFVNNQDMHVGLFTEFNIKNSAKDYFGTDWVVVPARTDLFYYGTGNNQEDYWGNPIGFNSESRFYTHDNAHNTDVDEIYSMFPWGEPTYPTDSSTKYNEYGVAISNSEARQWTGNHIYFDIWNGLIAVRTYFNYTGYSGGKLVALLDYEHQGAMNDYYNHEMLNLSRAVPTTSEVYHDGNYGWGSMGYKSVFDSDNNLRLYPCANATNIQYDPNYANSILYAIGGADNANTGLTEKPDYIKYDSNYYYGNRFMWARLKYNYLKSVNTFVNGQWVYDANTNTATLINNTTVVTFNKPIKIPNRTLTISSTDSNIDRCEVIWWNGSMAKGSNYQSIATYNIPGTISVPPTNSSRYITVCFYKSSGNDITTSEVENAVKII